MSKTPRPTEAPTGAQLEVLEIINAAGNDGLTAVEVWNRLNEGREVARTTVITLLQRLEQRGWLKRVGDGRGAIYQPLFPLEQASARIADGFLGRFFDGSASKMVLNLLGNGRLSEEEITNLRSILQKAEEQP